MRPIRSVFSEENKLSIAALYLSLPDKPAHRADDTVIGHQSLELFAVVLATRIRVMQQRVGFAAPPDCHHQRVRDELSARVAGGATVMLGARLKEMKQRLTWLFAAVGIALLIGPFEPARGQDINHISWMQRL